MQKRRGKTPRWDPAAKKGKKAAAKEDEGNPLPRKFHYTTEKTGVQ